jgi:hypothetical protein
MAGRISNKLDQLRRHPGIGHELLSVVLIAVVYVVAYVYWPSANPPPPVNAAASTPASASQQIQRQEELNGR